MQVAAGARGHFRLICEGWVPQDELFDVPGPLPRIERASGQAGARNAIAGPVWHAPAATSISDGLLVQRSVGLSRDLPDETGQLARDGDRNGGAAFAATRVEMRPATGEA